MGKTRYTDMRSVSLSEEQGIALDAQAVKEDRKPGSLIRVAVVHYLRTHGALLAEESSDEDAE